jgi:hypothetical protein
LAISPRAEAQPLGRAKYEILNRGDLEQPTVLIGAYALLDFFPREGRSMQVPEDERADRDAVVFVTQYPTALSTLVDSTQLAVTQSVPLQSTRKPSAPAETPGEHSKPIS